MKEEALKDNKYSYTMDELLLKKYKYPVQTHPFCEGDAFYAHQEEMIISVCRRGGCPQKLVVLEEFPRILNKELDQHRIEVLHRNKLYCEIHSTTLVRLQFASICVYCELEKDDETIEYEKKLNEMITKEDPVENTKPKKRFWRFRRK